jgi:soluble lytic murein transglycosylase-like protein
VQDRGLIGHVLADRIMRRQVINHQADLTAIQDWLGHYADLPEAGEIYAIGQKQFKKGEKVTLPHPLTAAAWSGTAGDLASNFHAFSAQPVKAAQSAAIAATYTAAAAAGATTRVSSGKTTKKAARQPEQIQVSPEQASKGRIDEALHRGDPFAAAALVKQAAQHHTVDAEALAEAESRIAAIYYYLGEVAEARQVAVEPAQKSVPLALWIEGLSTWRLGDAGGAAQAFTRLAGLSSTSTWDHAAASFWAYRSLKAAGKASEAGQWLAEAARQPRSFYGTLANEVLGHAPASAWGEPQLDAANLALIQKQPAGARALALLQIDQKDLAEHELRRLNPAQAGLSQGGRRDLARAMLALTEHEGFPALALQLSGIAANDNGKPYDAALYPLPPWQPRAGFAVEPALIYALMRRESQFNPKAVSASGACGLMQVLPSTASDLAEDDAAADHAEAAGGLATGNCPSSLMDPVTNIDLGQRYVRQLAEQPLIGNNLLYLVAAYNGGPGSVSRRLDDAMRKDPLLFIESLPARETRDYVEHVVVHYGMYRARLRQSDAPLAQIARGEWPKAQVAMATDTRHAEAGQAGGSGPLLASAATR